MRAVIGWVMSVAMVGCGTEASPVEKCDDLVDVICRQGVQCLGGTNAECVQALRRELPCGSARAVSASYDRCIEQLETSSCASLFPTNPSNGQPELRLPADCMEVILVREAPEEPVVSTPFDDVDLLRTTP